MPYRVELSPNALRQLGDLPPDAWDFLVDCLAVVVDDPDPTTTEPTEDPDVREAVFGEFGVVRFLVWDGLLVIVALNILWAG